MVFLKRSVKHRSVEKEVIMRVDCDRRLFSMNDVMNAFEAIFLVVQQLLVRLMVNER